MHHIIRLEIIKHHQMMMNKIPKDWGLYRRRHAEERIRAETARKLVRLHLEVIEAEVAAVEAELSALMNDPAFLRALKKYNGHTIFGWECACGVDGRLKKIAKSVGWTRFWAFIGDARRVHNIWPAR